MSERYKGPLIPSDQPEVVAAFCSDDQNPIWHELLEQLDRNAGKLLVNNGVSILKSEYRLKSAQRIREKLTYDGKPDWPLADIYGLRLIVSPKTNIDSIALFLREKYPTPEEFPWGLKTVRNWGNSHSHPSYNVTRLNIIFNEDKIAEFQVMTLEQYKIDQSTRLTYEENRKKLHSF